MVLPTANRRSVYTSAGKVALTFDLWPWIFVVYRLWRGQTLYQVWAKSNNSRRSSYGDFSVWHYDLEHVSRVAIRCEIIFTQFKFSQPIRSWHDFDADMLCHAVTLTFDLLTLNFCNRSGVTRSNLYQIWAKLNNPRMSYWLFSIFSGGGQIFKLFS